MKSYPYNFVSQEVQAAKTQTIFNIIDLIQQGNYCEAAGSDNILKTSYYLIIRISNLADDDFNTFINSLLSNILDLEKQVIENPRIKDKNGLKY